MSLAEIFDKIPKPKKRQVWKSQKQQRKLKIRARKWFKRGLFIVSTGDTKCLDCGRINFGHRLGCNCMPPVEQKEGVVYGGALNTGELGDGRMQPTIQTSEFITYKELYKRIIAGNRFYDISNRVELTAKHFRKTPK